MAKSSIKFNRADAPGATRKWAGTPGTYIGGRAAIDEADALATELERKWGVGRLRLLVGTELREKFDRQRYLFNRAVWHGQDLEEVRTQAGRMVKAWAALDRAATDAGKQPANGAVIEIGLEDGSVAAIVADNASAGLVQADGRKVAVYTAAEIGRLLTGFPALARAKEIFPGATVTAIREISDPLDRFADSRASLDDPLDDIFPDAPFDA